MNKPEKTMEMPGAVINKVADRQDLTGITALFPCQRGGSVPEEAVIAREVPVAISFDGTTHAVMMATPGDLEDFAIGFSLTEGLIHDVSEIENLEIVSVPHGIDIQLALVPAQRDAFRIRRRYMAGPVGCGLCGIESIKAALLPPPRFEGDFYLKAEEISNCIAELSRHQPLNDVTRCAHATGFYIPGKGLVAVREDIGRHNALDKLIGALLRCKQNFRKGIIAVTSRLSVELVQKAAIAGVPLLAAVSAPTAKAVQIAREANITLVARVRGDVFDIFTCPERMR